MSDELPPKPSTPLRGNALDPRGLIYLFLKHINPNAELDQSDEDLLKVFNIYATETGNADAKTSTSDLDIMRRCYTDTTVNESRGLYKGHIIETKINDDGSSVDVNVPVFIKRVEFEMKNSQKINACIKREKVDYGKLSEQSTDNEICKLKVTFVLKTDEKTVYVFVISEFCEGYTISDFVMKVFPFDIVAPGADDPKTIARKYATKFLIRLAKELLDFILWLHSKRYVYVDIKPENFIVGVVEFPKTEEAWADVFARPRIIRAIDFGGLQEYSTYGQQKIDVVQFKDPVTHSGIMDANGTQFFGRNVDGLLPPFALRSTDFSNRIKSTDFFPESYSFELNFKLQDILPKDVIYTSRGVMNTIYDRKARGIISADLAIYMDVYGAWILILSFLWYCAPHYNVLLIKFMVLLRSMIVKDNAETIWENDVNATFCKNHVAPYLLELYTEASIDENLFAIDNTTKNTEMKLEFTRLEESLRANDREKQKLETDITKNRTEMKNVQTYCEQTGPIYNEIAALFGARRIEPVCGGGGGGGGGGLLSGGRGRKTKKKTSRRRHHKYKYSRRVFHASKTRSKKKKEKARKIMKY